MEVSATPPEPQKLVRQRSWWRFALRLNTAAAIGLAIALTVMVNYLASRHYYRADWSRSQYFTLSDKTRTLLSSLSNRTDVVVFFQPGHALFPDVDNLLREYEAAAPRLRVERVDPDRDLARAEALRATYPLLAPNMIVFAQDGRTKYVAARDILEIDYSGMLEGKAPERTGFKGEQVFSSALLSVAQTRLPVVYHLQGHGERDLEQRDHFAGYSEVAQLIRRDNIELRPLQLADARAVPGDADALIIAAPQKRLSPSEIDLLRAYLNRNGRMLVLFDVHADGGLKDLMADWGVFVGENEVIDPKRTLTGLDLFVSDYADHPVTRSLHGVVSVLYLPRSVEPRQALPGADQPAAVSLMVSSDSSWAETDLEQKPVRFDTGRDRMGPISLAVAVEKGPVSGSGLEVDIRPTRLVVFGDGDFVANGALSGGNVDLFLNALNWLLERDQLLAIAPKAPGETRLVMDQEQLQLLFWTVVVGMPGAVALLGLLVWWRRRS